MPTFHNHPKNRSVNKVSYVWLSSVVVPELQRNISSDGFKNLLASVKDSGVCKPITVEEIDEHRYVIKDGLQRYHASELCGYKTIPAHIISKTKEEIMSKVCDTIELLQKFQLVGVKFVDDDGDLGEKVYHYKTPTTIKFLVGDNVLVQDSDSTCTFHVVKIVEFGCTIKTDKGYKYKWLLGNTDHKQWLALVKREEEQEEIYELAKQKKKREVATKEIKDLVGDNDLLKITHGGTDAK